MNSIQSDRLKGLAILQVVLIHSMAVFTPSQWSSEGALSIVLISIDQLSRICVPLFIFLSWYGLEKKYQGKSISYIPFMISRTKKLIPLYLLWSLGSLFLMSLNPMWQFSPQLPLAIKLLLGQSDYQHYFVPIIIFFYALFPLVSPLTLSIKKLLTPLILLGTIAWYLFLPKLQLSLTNGLLQPDQELYLWPFTWLWYAWIGMIAADFRLIERLNTYIGKVSLLVATIIFATLMVSNAHSLIHNGTDVLLALRFTNWPVLLYATIALFALSITVTSNDDEASWLSRIGSYSFLIYLSHTFFIRLTIAQMRVPDNIYTWLLGVGGFSLLLFLSWLILKKDKVYSILPNTAKD